MKKASSIVRVTLPCDTFPFLLDFLLDVGGDGWFLEGSSVGCEDGLEATRQSATTSRIAAKHLKLTRIGT